MPGFGAIAVAFARGDTEPVATYERTLASKVATMLVGPALIDLPGEEGAPRDCGRAEEPDHGSDDYSNGAGLT